LVSDSCFLSGLVKIQTEENNTPQQVWRPKYVFHYIQDRYIDPDFIVDISSVFDKKLESIKAYKTQFYNPDLEGPETYISKPQFLEQLIGSNQVFGKKIGVAYGEGFTTRKKIGVKSLDAFILLNT
jgi:LmbE family N-acetylglucosaminyl deacetylase